MIKTENLAENSFEEESRELESRKKRDLEASETVGKGGAAGGGVIFKGGKVCWKS